MGVFSRQEKMLASIFSVMLIFWAGIPTLLADFAELPMLARYLNVEPTVVALVGLTFIVLTGILSWDEIIGEKSAWDTLFWFAALMMLAEQLNSLGLIAAFSGWMSATLAASGMHWLAAAALLIAVFIYSHYAFASTTAHISAMFLAFLTVGSAFVPAQYLQVFMLMMAASGGIMMTLTHYATGTSPIIFASGFVSLGSWWAIGFVMSVVNLLIFTLIGGLWWKVLGYW